MAILSSEILWKLSTTAGSAGNSNTGVQASSLGKYISNTQWAGGVKNDLFNDITGDENAASAVKYRCVFVQNSNGASLVWQNAVAWIASQVAGGADIAMGVDPTGASPIGNAGTQAVTVANELTAPAGVTFSAPNAKSGGVAIGSVPSGYCRAIWIRQTANNTGAVTNDGATIQVEGDTAA